MPNRKNRKTVNTSKMFDKGKSKNKTCPKCGPGVFLAEHKNRTACGKCGYTEFKK
jgi:small subunit ribosomal protein S27Ae